MYRKRYSCYGLLVPEADSERKVNREVAWIDGVPEQTDHHYWVSKFPRQVRHSRFLLYGSGATYPVLSVFTAGRKLIRQIIHLCPFPVMQCTCIYCLFNSFQVTFQPCDLLSNVRTSPPQIIHSSIC